MLMLRAGLVVAALALLTGCRQASTALEPGAEAAPRPGTFCAELCSRSASLKCVAAVECPGFCEELLRSPVCHSEMEAALRCFAAQPTARWECSAVGLPSIVPGPCDAEQAAYRTCHEQVAPTDRRSSDPQN